MRNRYKTGRDTAHPIIIAGFWLGMCLFWLMFWWSALNDGLSPLEVLK